jgi:hypothetical protein
MRCGLELTIALTRFNHRHPNSILNAIEWLKKLTLGKHGCLTGRNQAVDTNHRRVADRFGHVVECLASGHICFPKSE